MAQGTSQTWQEIVAEKKLRQQAAIPKDWVITPPSDNVKDVTSFPEKCGLLSDKETEITNTVDVGIILGKLASGEWSSVEVTTAFYKRAIIAQQVVNCLTEIFVEQALARAARLDAYLKEHGKPIGPLHGLPISLKDQLSIKGLETTIGYVSWIGKYAEKDAALVEILYECGAVPFVRTNVPQTLMWPETFNNVFGRTTNPYNRTLTCGGSSGGEGALIGLRGSVLGVGSDIGGSIRIPSAFCGLYGLRPSYHRVPYAGAVNSLEGQDSLPSVLGPLSTSISGVKAFMQAVISAKPWLKDPLAVRKAWDQESYQLAEHGGGKALCFAIMWDDGIVVPHPPIQRAMKMVKDALIKHGHKVIDWVPLDHKGLLHNTRDIWNSASSEDYTTTTAPSGEPVITTMSITDDGEVEAPTFRPDRSEGVTAYALWQIQKERRTRRQEYLDHWNATVAQTDTGRPVDVIISPCAPYAAPPHGLNRSANYTTWCNSLDYPAFVVPVTKVDPQLDTKQSMPEKFLSDADKTNYELYDPATFENAPCAIQVVGRTLEEEAVIAMAEIVDAALKSTAAKL